MMRSSAGLSDPAGVATGTLLLAVAALIAVAVAVVILLTRGGNPIDCDDFRFDRPAWASNVGPERFRQARALDRCRTLEGRSKAAVRAMLGRPGRGPGADADRWSYVLGLVRSGPGFGDDRLLRVRFDSTGRVAGAAVVVGG